MPKTDTCPAPARAQLSPAHTVRDFGNGMSITYGARMLEHTLKALRRAPAFSAIAILSLGLAVAVNTSLFAFVDSLVNPPQPYANANRVWSSFTIGGDRRVTIPPNARKRALREALRSADATAPFATFSTMVIGNGTAEDRLVVGAAPNLFDLLGVHSEVGRSFDGSDESQSVAIISYAVWNQWFQRRPLESDLKVTVGSATFHVIGVMPRGVHFPLLTSVWIPLSSLPTEIRAQSPEAEIAFRLPTGATSESARRDLNGALERLAKEYGQAAVPSAILVPLHTRKLPFSNYRITLAIAALVLIIACANLGTMMLARGFARRREIAIRIALGAGRRAIWAEVLAECAVLSVAGVAVGMLLTLWAMDVIPHYVSAQIPLLGDIQPAPSWRVFAFASAACALIVLFAGWLPAARAGTMDPAEAIKDGGTSTDRMRDRYNPLLIVEVALSTGLLTTAGLYALFSSNLASYHFSYDANRLIVADLRAPAPNVAPSDVAGFYHGALARFGTLSKGGTAATRYFVGPDHGVITAEDESAGNKWMNLSRVAVVSPEYLRTLGIHVVEGRDFQAGDQTSATDAAIVDQLAARELWPSARSVVGHLLKLGPSDSRSAWVRVVGVAQRVELEPQGDPDLPSEPHVYIVRSHDATRDRQIVVRGDASGRAARSALAMSVREALQELAPWMGMAHVEPWLESYESSVSSTSFLAMAFGTLGVFGLTLCAVGIFGVAAYTVSRRAREFALRIALGAPTGHIMRVVMHDAGVMVLGGIGGGALATLWATRHLRDRLATAGYQLAVALVAAECALIVVAFAACYGPLLRAASADPVEVLRAN